MLKWNSNVNRFAEIQYSISIDPPPCDVTHIIVNDETIHGMDQLPIADIGEEIGLHDGNLHFSVSPPYKERLMMPQMISTSALLSPTYKGKQSTHEDTASEIWQARFSSGFKYGRVLSEG